MPNEPTDMAEPGSYSRLFPASEILCLFADWYNQKTPVTARPTLAEKTIRVRIMAMVRAVAEPGN
jgi:hypothetical protein